MAVVSELAFSCLQFPARLDLTADALLTMRHAHTATNLLTSTPDCIPRSPFISILGMASHMMPTNFPDGGEVVDFEIEEEPKWVTVKLQDGSVIQIKMEIVSILKAGHDPNTGLPAYMVQATNIIRLKNVDKKNIVRKSPDESKGQALYR
ncbi:MAG: hypothetical protein M1533_01815 [Candidatus Thermoplasmatota archaeon]|jgi:hypothetical protein|nr:hypothetical protein [Candidatus Thermoplasmatota archaeon]